MRYFRDTFKTRKRPFIIAFSICMTVSLNGYGFRFRGFQRFNMQPPKVFCKKRFLKNLTNFTVYLQASNSIKKRRQDRCLPMNFAKFLTTALLIEHL